MQDFKRTCMRDAHKQNENSWTYSTHIDMQEGIFL